MVKQEVHEEEEILPKEEVEAKRKRTPDLTTNSKTTNSQDNSSFIQRSSSNTILRSNSSSIQCSNNFTTQCSTNSTQIKHRVMATSRNSSTTTPLKETEEIIEEVTEETSNQETPNMIVRTSKRMGTSTTKSKTIRIDNQHKKEDWVKKNINY